MKTPPVSIPKPCPKQWSELHGDAREKFCDQCRHSVHNLSEMTARERAALLSSARGRLCVAYETDARGNFISRKDAAPAPRRTRRLWMRLAAVAASLVPLAFASCATRQTLGRIHPPADQAKAAPPLTDDSGKMIVGEFERPLWQRILWPWN